MTSTQGGHSQEARAKRRVMVVEEDGERCRWLEGLLTRHGLSVLAVHSVSATMNALKHERPDLLVAGGMLQGMTGEGLVECVRIFNGEVPIILVGNGHEPLAEPAPPMLNRASLPAEVSEAQLLMEVDRWVTLPAPAQRKPVSGTILLVDDDPKFRYLLQDFLEFKGFLVVTASTGEEALEILRQSAPSVVLLDMKLPGMDGLLTLKHLRLLHPNLPVIFVTTADDDHAKEEAVVLGSNDYLLKPFNFEYLETILLTKILA